MSFNRKSVTPATWPSWEMRESLSHGGINTSLRLSTSIAENSCLDM